MARPPKDGIDYFPLDVNTETDEKFQIIEAKHGVVGFGIIIKLYQAIYQNGYYLKWNNDLMPVISAPKWSSRRHIVTDRDVRETVRDAVRYGIFNKEMFEKFGILTSKGIQQRYFEVTKRRKMQNAKTEYLLVGAPENFIIADKNRVNVCNNSINVFNNEQSKVKESKYSLSESKCVFTPPTLEEIKKFCVTENLKINPEKFYYYYESKKWKNISDWQSKAKEWAVTEKVKAQTENSYAAYDIAAFEEMLDKE